MGTPAHWRQTEQVPGSGTSYVLTLSGLQLAAVLLTLVLIRPYGDRLPRGVTMPGPRLPLKFVVGCSGAGIATLSFLCIASATHWSNVDPFMGSAAGVLVLDLLGLLRSGAVVAHAADRDHLRVCAQPPSGGD